LNSMRFPPPPLPDRAILSLSTSLRAVAPSASADSCGLHLPFRGHFDSASLKRFYMLPFSQGYELLIQRFLQPNFSALHRPRLAHLPPFGRLLSKISRLFSSPLSWSWTLASLPPLPLPITPFHADFLSKALPRSLHSPPRAVTISVPFFGFWFSPWRSSFEDFRVLLSPQIFLEECPILCDCMRTTLSYIPSPPLDVYDPQEPFFLNWLFPRVTVSDHSPLLQSPIASVRHLLKDPSGAEPGNPSAFEGTPLKRSFPLPSTRGFISSYNPWVITFFITAPPFFTPNAHAFLFSPR